MTHITNGQPYTYQWFENRFKEAGGQAFTFFRSIDEEQFTKRPGEEIWCVGECYGHLNEFGERYMKRIREGLERAPEDRAEAGQSFTPGLVCRGVIKFFAPPYKMKINTFDPFEPRSHATLDKQAVVTRFLSLQDSLTESLKHAREGRIDLNGTKTSHPLFRYLRMTLAECYAIVEVHQRRHFWQAERVLSKLS